MTIPAERRWLAAPGLLLLLAHAAAGQCADPRPPSGGFALSSAADVAVTFSDGYRTLLDVSYPQTPPGSCGWPLVVLVPGLGAGRKTVAVEMTELAKQGYFLASYDVRGQGDARRLNPGRGSLLWALDEWIDLAEVIETIGATYRTRVDAGRVAVMGDSQGGVHAWAAAAWSGKRLPVNSRRSLPFPRIACAVPRIFAPQTSDVLVPGGTSFLYWLTTYAYDPTNAAVEVDSTFRAILGWYMDADDPAGLRSFLRLVPGKDFADELRTTSVPILHQLAWHDLFMPPNQSLAALALLPAATVRRLYLSTGLHNTPFNAHQYAVRFEMQLDWLRRYLKNEPIPVEQWPPVVSSVIPADPRAYEHLYALWRHRADKTMPPADVSARRLYLRTGSSLGDLPPGAGEGAGSILQRVQLGYDARAFHRDSGQVATVLRSIPLSALTFATRPQAADLELCGAPKLSLDVHAAQPDVQIGALLTAIGPDDRVQLVASGGVTLRGVDTRAPQRVEIELGNTSFLAPAGSWLQLSILNQALHVPGTAVQYRLLPLFRDFYLTIGHEPGRVSWLELPVRSGSRPDLLIGKTTLLARAPEVRTFQVVSSASLPGRSYLVLASLSGQGPPILLPGGSLLWLLGDPITEQFFNLANSAFLSGFAGVLDNTGSAAAKMDLGRMGPLPPGLVGRSLYFAPIVFDSVSRVLAGAPVAMRIE